MNYKIISTFSFEKELKALLKKYPSLKKDIEVIAGKLQDNPQFGIPLGYDCYKIRLNIKSKGRGKAGVEE